MAAGACASGRPVSTRRALTSDGWTEGRCRDRLLLVLLVGHVFAPRHRAAGLVVLLHRDVGREAVGRRAVPVVLLRIEEDAVARADDLDLTALALAEADALGDEDRLAVRMGMPSRPRARCEVHSGGGEG